MKGLYTRRNALVLGGSLTAVAVYARKSGYLFHDEVPPSSRGVVIVDGASSSVFTPSPFGIAAIDAVPSDFANLRARWRVMQTGGTGYNPAAAPFSTIIQANDAAANGWWTTMNKSAGRTYLWNDPASSGEQISNTKISCDRLRSMAIAWATNGSAYQGNTAMLADINSALQFVSGNRFNTTIAKTGSGFDWEIGVPLVLLDALVVLGTATPPAVFTSLLDAVERFSPDPYRWNSGTSTGANRTWKSQIVFVRGMLVDSGPKIQSALAALITVFSTVSSGDGFYTDGSFIQHNGIPNAGGYAQSLLGQTSNILYAITGSPWALNYDQWAPVRNWVYDTFEPIMYKGAAMDMVRGREIARHQVPDRLSGARISRSIVLLSEIATGSHVNDFKGMVKYWIQSDTARPFFTSGPTNLDVARLAQATVSNDSIPSRGEIPDNKQFSGMDRVVHRRPSFCLALALYSNKVMNYESINGENGKGWHTGSGMTFLYNTSQLNHYGDDYWPTVDSYRLPGTTVDKRTRGFAQGESSYGQAVVGGARYGQSGVACMQLSSDGGQLVAKKAWFMLGDYVACLGSGITSSTSNAVETIIENRNIGASGTNAVVHGPSSTPTLTSFENVTTLSGTSSINITGVGGYHFPAGNPALRALRTVRTGNWREINASTSVPNDTRTRRYVTLWFDHGAGVINGSYAYVMLPTASAAATASYAAAPYVVVLENSTTAQVVRGVFPAPGPTHYGAIFWANASKTVNVLTCNRIACVFIRKSSTLIEIGISDPTAASTTPIVLTVSLANSSIASADPGITVARDGTAATITFNPTGSAGQSRSVVLNA